jgi:hypothetical protein
VPSVLVSFSTTKGSLNPTSDLSNEQGEATAVLSTTETATVTATSGGSATALTGSIVVIVPGTTIPSAR